MLEVRRNSPCALISFGVAVAQLAFDTFSPLALRNAVWRAALAKDHSDPRTTYLASIAKAYSSQIAVSNADKCVQIFGGAVSFRKSGVGFRIDHPVRILVSSGLRVSKADVLLWAFDGQGYNTEYPAEKLFR